MADDTSEGSEISRRIREELDRIREAEARVTEALDAVRQARRRVELVAREIGREEQRVRALVREELAAAELAPGEPSGEATPARGWRSEAATGWSTRREEATRPLRPPVDPGSGSPPSPRDVLPLPTPSAEPVTSPPTPSWPEPPRGAPTLRPKGEAAAPRLEPRYPPRWRSAVIGAAAIALVGLIGWFAIRGLQRDQPRVQVESEGAPTAAVPPSPAADPAKPAAPSAAAPLDALPSDPASRVALYDSLFAARSPVFDSVVAAVQDESRERAVDRAVAAWRNGAPDVQQADLLHNAIVQYVLKREVDPRIEIDGQLLRNPCRGRSCGALLTLWRTRRAAYGLGEVPNDAATDLPGLRQAEVAVVLGYLRGAAGAPSAAADSARVPG